MCYQKEETKYYIHNVLLFGVIQERKRKLIISDRNTVLYIGMIELDLVPCQPYRPQTKGVVESLARTTSRLVFGQVQNVGVN